MCRNVDVGTIVAKIPNVRELATPIAHAPSSNRIDTTIFNIIALFLYYLSSFLLNFHPVTFAESLLSFVCKQNCKQKQPKLRKISVNKFRQHLRPTQNSMCYGQKSLKS